MQKNQVTLMWPTYIGEFYNPKHNEIKKDLLNFFENYKKIMKIVEKAVPFTVQMMVLKKKNIR